MKEKRADLSRFIVHLTRDYNGISARDNLLNILKTKKIEARNYHCLFAPKIKKLPFSDKLKSYFKTVCFTETPLAQIKHITCNIPGRKIKLKPYGIVFWRDDLLNKGANPAIYINASGNSLRDYLINQFEMKFKNIKTLNRLRQKEKEYYREIIQYFSLINIVSDKYDFMWEREWRYHGDFKFMYRDIVAIICENPEEFENICNKKFKERILKYIKRIPMISPNWSYEQVIEELSCKLWEMRPKF